MKMRNRMIALILVTVMSLGLFAGCGNAAKTVNSSHAGHIETLQKNVLTPVADSQVVFLSEGTSEVCGQRTAILY